MSHPSDRTPGWRVIVTDDKPEKVNALTTMLRDAGLCVFAAYDGASALELVIMLPRIDLLITNTRLGHIDGPELMRRTRQERPGLPILHVIHQDGQWKAPMPTPTIAEPFTAEELMAAVRGLLA